MNFKLLEFPDYINSQLNEKSKEILSSGFWSNGPESKNLENNLSKFYQRECITVSSGGTALQLLNESYKGIKRIAIQSNTYFASCLPWINSNAEILLLGSVGFSLMPSLEVIKEALNKNPDAIILTHIGGYPNPDIESISELCKRRGIILIEDCAHSPLVKINNKYVGTFGDAAILSFFPTKPIPAGEGGLVIIKDKEKANCIRKMKDYGKFINYEGKVKHFLPAYPNARLNEFSAGIANVILKNYSDLIYKKRKIANLYDSNLQKDLLLSNQYDDSINFEPSYYKYICFLNESKYKTSQVYDKDNQLLSIFKDNAINYTFIGENEFSKEHICLPITYSMTEEDAINVLRNCK